MTNKEAAREAVEWLQKGFVFLDFETTSPSDDPQVGVVEIGLINHQGQVILHTRVAPERPITPKAEQIHGLQQEEVQDAPNFAEIYPQLEEALSDRQVVAYSIESEQEILESVCRRYDLPPIRQRAWHDAARVYADFRSSQRFLKLIEAAGEMGLDTSQAHGSLGPAS